MTFRTPLTSASAVDTRTAPTVAGVRMYEAPNPDTGAPYGVVEWDDGITGDTPARIVQTATPNPSRSISTPYGRLAITGGSYGTPSGVVKAPELDLSVDQDPNTAAPLRRAQLTAPDGFLVNGAQVATVGGDWTDVVQYTGGSIGIPTSWTTIAGASATITIPAGLVLEVRFDAPKLQVATSSTGAVRLMINGAVRRAVECDAPGAAIAIPVSLAASLANTGSTPLAVPVAVQAICTASGASIMPAQGAPIELAYRFR